MRIKEIKKNGADIEHGLVIMSVEGSMINVESLQKHLVESGWKDTACVDEIDDEVFALYYVMNRDEVTNFRADFKKVKRLISKK